MLTPGAMSVRRMAGAILGAAALALPAAAVASHGGNAGGPRDFTTGSAGNETPFPSHIEFAAYDDPVTGHFRARGDLDGDGPMEPFAFEGEITCVRVEGNRASLKYRFKHAEGSGAIFERGGVEVFIEDNGEPSDGESVDRSTFRFPESAATFNATATFCEDPDLALYDPIESGNLTVHDAP
jgi:hypothetical protein